MGEKILPIENLRFGAQYRNRQALFLLRRCLRNDKSKRAPLPEFAFNPYPAAMELYQGLTQGKAEAGPLVLLLIR